MSVDDGTGSVSERQEPEVLSAGTKRRRPAWVQIGRVLPRSVAATWRASRPQAGPVPRMRLRPTAWPLVYFDDLLLTVATMRSTAHSAASVDQTIRDTEETVRRLGAAGFIDNPEAVHAAPPVPTDVRRTQRARPGLRFEHVSFRSGYEPPVEIPGQDRWFVDDANAVAHAYVLRHDDAPRPWLLALHPYGTGEPRDILLMGSLGLHRQLGVNIIHPVAPRHGPRRREKGGVQFPGPDSVMSFLGMSQAIWDLRRWVGWVRSQGATAVGVHGVSFGGYCSAMLASLEPGLDSVVAAVPVVDLRALAARHIGRLAGHDTELCTHLSDEAPMTLGRLITPLAFEPKVAPSGRNIFAAVGDRFAPPDHAVQLWHHWGEPAIRWHHGSHISAVMLPDWRRFVVDALRRSGVVEHRGTAERSSAG
jgi:hypothetical protein